MSALLNYPRFLWKALGVATDGGIPFITWMTALTAIALVGINAWAHQLSGGMALTALNDHVSWGLYVGNFSYGVGLAAGAVTMMLPAYIFHDDDMHDVVIVGQILAVAVIIGSLIFVTVDIGRPEQSWHLIPYIGRFNWPVSMLSWDVVVLSVYLGLNLHATGYLLYMRYLGRKPEKRWILPFIFGSIVWAFSLHTVAAFLYCGLGGRPIWNSAVLAPRFVVSAFLSGAAIMVISLQVLSRFTDTFEVKGAISTLLKIVRVTILLNLFLVAAEVFTEFYTGTTHAVSAQYLFFGLHGHNALVPWIWSALAMEVVAALILFTSDDTHLLRLDIACALILVAIWIEKGMAMVVPGFVPDTLHELVEYLPNALEWKVSAGVLAVVLMVFTLGLKLASAIFSGEMRAEKP